MKMYLRSLEIIIFMLILNFFGNEAKLESCENSIENEVCYKDIPYLTSINPEPLPNFINVTLNVNDVTDVNEEDQTVTLMLKLILEWNDPRLSVKRSKEYIERQAFRYLISTAAWQFL